MMWDNGSKQYYPALIAFARDQEGRITGGQSIYLNQETGAKADIAVNKRSFGKISGCFVEIQQDNQQGNKSRSNITIIAEGVETALSLQEAGIKGKIICSLGISNIKNYQPTKGEKIIIAADNDGQSAVSVSSVIKAKEQLTAKGAVVSVIMPQDMGDFNDMLKAQGAESIKKFIEPEIAKLISNETLNEKTTKFTESLKPVNNADNNKSQIKSIELELGKSANHDILQKFQWQIKSLERFTTKENINTALQIYKEKGIESFILYSKNSCSKAIEQKITKDLQIMKNKFAPNYNLGNVRFCDIVINDFRGKSYAVPEDYLVAIGKDKQVMQYINPQSVIGKEIKNELQNAAETQKNQGIIVKATI
uniref:toprim domain-containing protein n=2 Tax=Rickettsia endosymbiont of Oedothorax gibbosus TaxID=931099 RepID=UPI00397A8CBE